MSDHASESSPVRIIGSRELHQNLPGILRELENHKARYVLTVHGKPRAVLIGAEPYLNMILEGNARAKPWWAFSSPRFWAATWIPTRWTSSNGHLSNEPTNTHPAATHFRARPQPPASSSPTVAGSPAG